MAIHKEIQVEFYSDENTPKIEEFGGTHTVEFTNSSITFNGNYIIIEDDNQVGRVFGLNTIKAYKIVNK